MRLAARFGAPRPVVWVGAIVVGSLVGLSLRLACFFTGVLLLKAFGHSMAQVASWLPFLDPVYTHAAERSLVDLHIRGVAVVGPLGELLHTWLPGAFAPASRAGWSFVRLVVEPGSPVLARLLASSFANAAVLGTALVLLRRGWRGGHISLAIAGLAMQVQVALGILGAQPSIRELEATGVSFAANALLPGLAPRSLALTDAPAQVGTPVLSAALVALALLVGYLPIGVILLLRHPSRRLTLASAAIIMLGAGACAGAIKQDAALAGPPLVLATSAAGPSVMADSSASAAKVATTFDRWFDEPTVDKPEGPSHVEVVGSDFHYQYLVNGRPELIKGMGLNTQYSRLLSPTERAARIDADMTALSALGVNTVTGWEPPEFDSVLLDSAQRHKIGVIMPFDLDPEADYTDPAVRQRLHDEALAWVAQYRESPALRMWGLGNEVLHKIVHPAWVGPQDPARERQAVAFSDWLVQTADDIHALDPNHPVTYRSAEDAFVGWVVDALQRSGGGPRPWFVWGTNCYQAYLGDILDHWTRLGMPNALWVSEFAPGGIAIPDRPDGFATMWGYVRKHPDWVLGGAVYAWTRNGPEGVDRNFGLTDDGVVADEHSLEMLRTLFHSD